MYVALQIAAALSVLSEPFLPFTSEKLTKMLGLTLRKDPGLRPLPGSLSWESISLTSDLLPAGNKIGQAELLFAKIEDEQIQQQVDKLEATKTANAAENKQAEPQKDLIQYEDFAKMDI